LKYAEIDGFQQITLLDKHSDSSFSCIPALDGMLSRLSLKHKNGPVKLIKTLDSKQELDQARECFMGILLFPFPNRLAKGSYSHLGRNFSFPINEERTSNNLHAIINKEFILKDVDLEKGSITLVYIHSGSYGPYPFSSKVMIEYSLGNSQLDVKMQILNKEEHEIPVGIGSHPYFNFGLPIEDVLLEIPSKEFVQVNEDLIPNGHIVRDNSFSKLKKIGATEFDTCYVLDDRQVCHIYVPERDMHFYLKQDSGRLPYLHIFIPSARDSIALEPVSCIPDAFNNGIGLVQLAPKSEIDFSYSVSID